MYKILICDDQQVVREGLEAILSTTEDISVVGLASNGTEAIDMAGTLNPDMVLMDLKMPVMNGIQATRELKASFPQISVLILTTFAEEGWLIDAIRAGAAGYLLKDTSREDLVKAIRGTMSGQTFIDPSIAGKLFPVISQNPQPIPSSEGIVLTGRESDILQLLVKGRSNPQIASELFLATGTVRNYVSSLFQKLKVADRTQAAVEAIRRGWAKPPDDR